MRQYKQLYVHIILLGTLAELPYIGSTCSLIWEFILTFISEISQMNGDLKPFVYFTKYKYPLKAQTEYPALNSGRPTVTCNFHIETEHRIVLACHLVFFQLQNFITKCEVSGTEIPLPWGIIVLTSG